MTNNTDGTRRVLIAITESCPVDLLWRAAIRRLAGSGAALTAIYVAEGHWHRAASLPFTREISRVSGANEDFTPQRASQVSDAAATRAKEMIGKLALAANLSPAFEVLAESDLNRLRDLLAGAGNLLIAPSLIRRRPIFAEFEKLGCRIELVEDDASPSAARES